MKFLRPKSLSGLILLGFAVVALPLVLAVVRAATHMNRLADDSQSLVIQGVRATSESQLLNEQLAAVERSALLYRVTGDADMLASYQDKHRGFIEVLDRVASLPTDDDARSRPARLRRQALQIAGAMATLPADSPELELALTAFEDMDSTAAAIVRDSNRYIDSGLQSLQQDAASVQREVAWQTALLVPGTLVMILLFTLLLARPIRQIDRAISALGEGAFSRPIKVKGPRDLEALARQLEWLRVRLLEQAREKNKFLRHMSHELKTPLANIREGTELLMDGAVGELEDPQREVAGILRDNGVALQKLIENLLSFSAWQSKISDLDLSSFHLKPLIQQVIDNQKLALAGRAIRIETRLTDVTLRADETKLRMVLDNLLTNAVKFTPMGGTIYLRSSVHGQCCQIDVADTGPGIPPQERQRIFEAFYQGTTPQGGHVQGTGIGLSVVMECINAHGGAVEILEGTFPGAHFRLTLPLEPELMNA